MYISLLITVVVLINYFIKRDLYFSILLGTSLLIINLLTFEKIPLNVLTFKTNITYYVNFLIIIFFVFGMKYIHTALDRTDSKKQITEISNKVLRDKNIKILLVILFSLIMAPHPFIGLILIIFVATFLNFSTYNIVFLPILSTLVSSTFYYTFNTIGIQVSRQLNFGIKIIVIYYAIMYITYLIENNHKNNIVIRRNLIDLLFTIILLILNIFIYGVTYTLSREIYVSTAVSLLLTIAAGRIIITKISVFNNLDEKLEDKIVLDKMNALATTNVPYLIILGVILVELFLYYLVIELGMIGIFIFTLVNVVLVKRLKVVNMSQEHIEKKVYVPFSLLSILLLVEFLLYGYGSGTLSQSRPYFERLFTDFFSGDSAVLNYLLNLFTGSLLPMETMFHILNLNSMTLPEETSEIMLHDFQLINYIQMLFGLVTFYVIDFIFTIKENKKFQILGILLIFSGILQLIIILFV